MTPTVLSDTAIADLFRLLPRRPVFLFALLFATNALFFPYLGFVHDARLYSGQVLNALDPTILGGDLFFRYGSQDKFSLFSVIIGPLVRLLGIDLAFFVGYVMSVAVLLSGMQRLVTRLFPDSAGAVLGLFYAAVIPLSYGVNVFHVVEPFLSPRLLASGLALWGLDFVWQRRWLWAGAVLGLGLALHPLMTFPAMVLAIGFGIWRNWSGKVLVGCVALCALTLAGFLAMPTLAVRFLGDFDPEWKRIILACAPYHFPRTWPLANWIAAFKSIAFVAAAALWLRPTQSQQSQFLAAAACLGLIGLAGSLVAAELPYAVPIMGQPYRFLWIPAALTPVAGFFLADSLWRTGRPLFQLIAITLLASLVMVTSFTLEAVFVVFAMPIVCLWTLRTPARSPIQNPVQSADRIAEVALGCLVVGTMLWSVFRAWMIFVEKPEYAALVEPLFRIKLALECLKPGMFLVLIVFLVAFLARRTSPFWTGSLIALALAGQTTFYLVPRTEAYQAHSPIASDIRFVGAFLDEQRPTQPLCVYTNLQLLNHVWIDWRVQCYFDLGQAAGFIFNKPSAVEGARRAKLVGPFEIAHYRPRWLSILPTWQATLERFHGVSLDGPPPTRADLLRLAQDEMIDYIVLWDVHFPELCIASSGAVSIYDSRQLRAIRDGGASKRE